jgi:membrane protein
MNAKAFFQLLKETFSAWDEDKCPRLGAALAYYTIFSIAPLLIIGIGITGFVFGEQAARGEIVGQIESAVGQPAAMAIEEMLKNTHAEGSYTFAAVVGIVLLLFGASGVFIQLQDALNTIWKVAPKPDRGIRGIVRDRLLSFMVVLGTGLLLLVSLVISATLAALSKFLTPAALPGGTYLWQGINGLISFLLITLLFALIYKVLPDVRIAWRDVWVGAIVTALLFTLGKYLIGLYLGRSSTTSAFGAAGSLVVILVWVYYSSQLLLFGAEFTRVYANKMGSPLIPTDNAIPVTLNARARQGMPPSADLGAWAHAGHTA